MKKITLYTFLIFLLSATIGRAGDNPGKNVLNTFFFFQDFASGIPNTWTNVDDAGTGLKWNYTLVGNTDGGTGQVGALEPSGTSAANGYVIFDSDASYDTAGDASLTTPRIDCSLRTGVHLAFNEYFAQWLSSIGEVDVSNNGVTWTTVHSAEAGLGPNSAGANPNAVD